MQNLEVSRNPEIQSFIILDKQRELKILIGYEALKECTENMAKDLYIENIDIAINNKSSHKNENGYYESKIFSDDLKRN